MGFILLQLLRSLCNRLIQFTIRKGLANVTEDRAFFTGDSDTFEGPDLEKFWTEKGDVCIVCDAGVRVPLVLGFKLIYLLLWTITPRRFPLIHFTGNILQDPRSRFRFFPVVSAP